MSALDEIRTLAGGFSGIVGVWAQSLDTGETIEWNADESFPAASTIKVPILCEVFRQAGEGRFRLSDPVVMRADDVVPGSGILKDLTPGVTLPVRDLVTLMIVVSDNTATNLLIDLVGVDSVNEHMARLGLTGTRVEFKLFKAPQGAPMNRSTPRDLGRLMAFIATDAILTPQVCADMLGILGRQHFTDHISRRLPEYDGYLETGKAPAVTVASKSGAIRGTRNDVGLVQASSRRYVVSMMSKGCTDLRFYQDNEASVLLPQVSAVIFQLFAAREIPV
jgi:beta-lactamase class A